MSIENFLITFALFFIVFSVGYWRGYAAAKQEFRPVYPDVEQLPEGKTPT